MAEAIHFLSRLDRVSLPQADLALGLYRESKMLLMRQRQEVQALLRRVIVLDYRLLLESMDVYLDAP